MLQLYLPFKNPKKKLISGIFIKISQKPMINEETLGFFTNPYPYLPKPIPVTRGAGFLGLGYRLAQKTPVLPVPIPKLIRVLPRDSRPEISKFKLPASK